MSTTIITPESVQGIMRPAGMMSVSVPERKDGLMRTIEAGMLRLIKEHPVPHPHWSRETFITRNKPDEGYFRRGDKPVETGDGRVLENAKRFGFHWLRRTRGFLRDAGFPVRKYVDMFDALDEFQVICQTEIVNPLAEALDGIYPDGNFHARLGNETAQHDYSLTRVVAYEAGHAAAHYDRCFGTVTGFENYPGFEHMDPITRKFIPFSTMPNTCGLFLGPRLAVDVAERGHRKFPSLWHRVVYKDRVKEAVGMRIAIVRFFYAFPYTHTLVTTRSK